MTSGSLTASRLVPAERSSFIGRRGELDDVRRLLGSARLVTLVGPGGVGKTRLAIRTAGELAPSFAGTAFCELGTVRDSAVVASKVAEALDVRDLAGGWLVGRLAAVVADRRLLLVVDNCEHLLDACGVLVDALLASCPGLHVLATSRRPLDVEGEAVLAIAPLATPAAGAADALSYPSVQLLLDRARAAVPGVDTGALDAEALAELCRRLDGLPLAIEMAAVRMRTLSPEAIVARLDDRFRLLSRSRGTGPERHRSLQATLEWSLELLTPPERLMWRRASVFAGTFSFSAAEAVCVDDRLPAAQVLDAMTGLVEASLLEVVHGGAEPRFRMLESVCRFGQDLLDRSPESEPTHRRHVDWCARTAASAAADLSGPGQVAAFDRLQVEHAELAAAIRYCLGKPGLHRTALRIVSDLWLYWQARGHLTEGRRLVHAALAAAQEESGERARALTVAGFLTLSGADPSAAVPLLEQGLALASAHDDAFTVALATQYLGTGALFLGDPQRAERLLRRAADLHAALDPRYSAFCLADVGISLLLSGRLEAAAEVFRESLETNARGGDPWSRSHALWGLSLARLLAGDAAGAVEVGRQSLRLMREIDDRSGIARCVEALSWAAAAQHDWDQAARLGGAAEAVWASIPADAPGPVTGLRARFMAPGPEILGERRWFAVRRQGTRVDRAAAVTLALGESGVPLPPAAPQQEALTRRQREVAGLVAEGLTDREIAARLVISPRTAESHVEQILARLGLRNRAQIAAWTAAAS